MQPTAKSKQGKRELTPLERETRKSIIVDLSKYGLTNSSIALIMNMHESTVSRMIKDSE